MGCGDLAADLRSIAMVERKVLTWKYEDGPQDAPDEGSADDVGPAWIDTYEDDERVSEEKVLDGVWINRSEAERIASENGYTFAADDGSDDGGFADEDVDRLIVQANQWLRDSLFDDAVYVERIGDELFLREPNGRTQFALQAKAADVASFWMELHERLKPHLPPPRRRAAE